MSIFESLFGPFVPKQLTSDEDISKAKQILANGSEAKRIKLFALIERTGQGGSALASLIEREIDSSSPSVSIAATRALWKCAKSPRAKASLFSRLDSNPTEIPAYSALSLVASEDSESCSALVARLQPFFDALAKAHWPMLGGIARFGRAFLTPNENQPGWEIATMLIAVGTEHPEIAEAIAQASLTSTSDPQKNFLALVVSFIVMPNPLEQHFLTQHFYTVSLTEGATRDEFVSRRLTLALTAASDINSKRAQSTVSAPTEQGNS